MLTRLDNFFFTLKEILNLTCSIAQANNLVKYKKNGENTISPPTEHCELK
jgi:hypothetical protein